MLSKKTISELKIILLEEYGFECSQSEASEIAISLVQLVETLKEIDAK